MSIVKLVFNDHNIDNKSWHLMGEDPDSKGEYTIPIMSSFNDDVALEFAEQNNLIVLRETFCVFGKEFPSLSAATKAIEDRKAREHRKKLLLDSLPKSASQDSFAIQIILDNWDVLAHTFLEG